MTKCCGGNHVLIERTVLHTVYKGTGLNSASFLRDTTKTIRKSILECSATIYTGLTSPFFLDQRSSFG